MREKFLALLLAGTAGAAVPAVAQAPTVTVGGLAYAQFVPTRRLGA